MILFLCVCFKVSPIYEVFSNISFHLPGYGKESSIFVPGPSRIYRPDREVAKLRAGADLQNILDDKPLEY